MLTDPGGFRVREPGSVDEQVTDHLGEATMRTWFAPYLDGAGKKNGGDASRGPAVRTR
jgi:hypothetical protein